MPRAPKAKKVDAGKKKAAPRKSESRKHLARKAQPKSFVELLNPPRIVAIVEKKPKVKKAKGKKKSHPPYLNMAIKAIKSNGDPYLSAIGIAKFIEENYPQVSESFKRHLRIALNKGVEEKILVQHRASFRLSAKTLGSKKKRSSKKEETSESESESEEEEVKKPVKRSRSPKKVAAKEEKEEKSRAPKKRKRESSKKGELVKEGKKARGSAKPAESLAPVLGGESIDAPRRPPGLKADYIWQYKDGRWKNYDPKASDVVEDVYQNYLAARGDSDVRAVKSGEWEYMVDFVALKQTNIQHANHTIRDIRRVKIVD